MKLDQNRIIVEFELQWNFFCEIDPWMETMYLDPLGMF